MPNKISMPATPSTIYSSGEAFRLSSVCSTWGLTMTISSGFTGNSCPAKVELTLAAEAVEQLRAGMGVSRAVPVAAESAFADVQQAGRTHGERERDWISKRSVLIHNGSFTAKRKKHKNKDKITKNIIAKIDALPRALFSHYRGQSEKKCKPCFWTGTQYFCCHERTNKYVKMVTSKGRHVPKQTARI